MNDELYINRSFNWVVHILALAIGVNPYQRFHHQIASEIVHKHEELVRNMTLDERIHHVRTHSHPVFKNTPILPYTPNTCAICCWMDSRFYDEIN